VGGTPKVCAVWERLLSRAASVQIVSDSSRPTGTEQRGAADTHKEADGSMDQCTNSWVRLVPATMFIDCKGLYTIEKRLHIQNVQKFGNCAWGDMTMKLPASAIHSIANHTRPHAPI
jgi:hypothetical protein